MSGLDFGYSVNSKAGYFDRSFDAMTSFDELSVAGIETKINLKSVYPISALRDRITTANGGSVTKGNGVFQIATSADANSEVLFESVERGRYVAGLDAVAGIGMSLPSRPTGNQEVEWGYTDFQNGFVVGEDVTGIYMAVYSGGTRSDKVYQSDWNIDTLEAGPFTLDPAELNIYRFAFRWYGRGPVTLELAAEEGDISRKMRVHQFRATPGELITQDPNQPISVRVRNNGTEAALQVDCAGRNFGVRGVNSAESRQSGAIREAVTVGTSGFTPLVSARHKNGDYNSISTILGGMEIITDNDIEYRIVVQSTLTGASWVDPSFSDTGQESAMEYDISATSFTGGLSFTRPFLAVGSTGNKTSLSVADIPTLELPSDLQAITLCARALTTSATVTAVMSIMEEW